MKPHVVVLGWHDASERHVRAIARLHEARGSATSAFQSTSNRFVLDPSAFAALGRRLADTVAATTPAPLVLHAFSNAGLWAMVSMLDALRSSHPARHRAVRAVVLDSAPGFPEAFDAGFTAERVSKAFLPGLLARAGQPPGYTHPVWSPLLGALFAMWHHAAPAQVRTMQSAPRRLREHLVELRAPLLAVYGEADPLVHPSEVEGFLKRCRQDSIRCEAVRLADSGHVQHLVRHRATVWPAITAFLDGLSTRQSTIG